MRQLLEKSGISFIVLFTMWVSGCGQSSEQNIDSSMQNIFENYLSGKIEGVDYRINYDIGDDFRGKTSMVLWGNGKYRIESSVTQGRKTLNIKGTVADHQVIDLTQCMISKKLWEVKHIRPIPGDSEPSAKITITSGDKTHSVELWVGEIRKTPAFKEVQDLILSIIKRESNNEILEVGR